MYAFIAIDDNDRIMGVLTNTTESWAESPDEVIGYLANMVNDHCDQERSVVQVFDIDADDLQHEVAPDDGLQVIATRPDTNEQLVFTLHNIEEY